MNLNFKISELIHSDKANLHKINNMPDINSLDNMLNLVFHCLQPLRDKIGKPFIISSGYRCKELNRLVGGKENSQHLTGSAVDFRIQNMSVAEGIEAIKKTGIEYDQLLDEYSNWIHISYVKGKNRKEYKKIR